MIKEIKQLTAQLEKQAEAKPTLASARAAKRFLKQDREKQLHFLINLADYWKIIKLVLKLVKVFTGPKADAKIDEVIAWGDENL